MCLNTLSLLAVYRFSADGTSQYVEAGLETWVRSGKTQILMMPLDASALASTSSMGMFRESVRAQTRSSTSVCSCLDCWSFQHVCCCPFTTISSLVWFFWDDYTSLIRLHIHRHTNKHTHRHIFSLDPGTKFRGINPNVSLTPVILISVTEKLAAWRPRRGLC